MATAAQISMETYLATSYEPDADFIDGVLEERAVGEYDHNAVQMSVLLWFHQHGRQWKIRAIQEQRTRVAPNKIRIPDVCVFSRDLPIEQIFTRPQLIAIEVLSPEDRPARVDARLSDYRAFGIPNLWVIDPAARQGWNCSSGIWLRTERFEVPNSPIYLSLSELFLQIDADLAD